jgi:hypothetical protein
MSHFVIFGIPLLLGIVLTSASPHVVSMVQDGHAKTHSNGDYGNVTNCGDKSTKFLLDWSPRVLKPGITVSIDASWTLIDQFSHGDLCATIWLQGVAEPIYKDCHDENCEDAKKAVYPFIQLQCPVPKDFSINFRKFTYKLQPTIPLPSGKFTIHLTIENEKKVQLLCVKGDVEIIDE